MNEKIKKENAKKLLDLGIDTTEYRREYYLNCVKKILSQVAKLKKEHYSSIIYEEIDRFLLDHLTKFCEILDNIDTSPTESDYIKANIYYESIEKILFEYWFFDNFSAETIEDYFNVLDFLNNCSRKIRGVERLYLWPDGTKHALPFSRTLCADKIECVRFQILYKMYIAWYLQWKECGFSKDEIDQIKDEALLDDIGMIEGKTLSVKYSWLANRFINLEKYECYDDSTFWWEIPRLYIKETEDWKEIFGETFH